jgi:four helix bundle protein
MPGFAKSHRELDVYQKAVEAAMRVYEHTKSFPREEMYSLTDQIRRSSRSVAANFAEAWRRRRYEAAFVAKLTDCEAEAAETQTWIEFAVRCNLLEREAGAALYREYEEILRMLVAMILKPESWLLAGTP